MKEEWKAIKGYEGLYEISSLGRVKRLAFVLKDKNGIEKNNVERITEGSKTEQGYIRLGLTKNGKRIKYLVHRLIAQAFIPNPESKEQVNHKNGIKDDNRIENLEWCTHAENVQHAYDELGFKREQFLSDETVRYIRENYEFRKGGEMSRELNIPQNTILQIVRGETYKRVV